MSPLRPFKIVPVSSCEQKLCIQYKTAFKGKNYKQHEVYAINGTLEGTCKFYFFNLFRRLNILSCRNELKNKTRMPLPAFRKSVIFV